MPGQLIKLNPSVSPNDYYQQNQDLGVVPSGTGIEILFKIDGEYYLIAGPRTNKVLTVFGGSIENKEGSFFAQLVEEMNEETFGVMNLSQTQNGYKLLLNDGCSHALSMLEAQTFLTHKPGRYAYVTFTALCETLTLEQLKQLAAIMSPTAKFWNQIGNYLFAHINNDKIPKDESFTTYWEEQEVARSAFIAKLVEDCKELISENSLLINPADVFSAVNVEQALNKLHDVNSFKQLMTLFKHTVGRYSERSGYYVFKATDLLLGVQEDCDSVKDINEINVALGIFNKDAVSAVFPTLNITINRPVLTATVGFTGNALTSIFNHPVGTTAASVPASSEVGNTSELRM